MVTRGGLKFEQIVPHIFGVIAIKHTFIEGDKHSGEA
jgi:hypothetical protein